MASISKWVNGIFVFTIHMPLYVHLFINLTKMKWEIVGSHFQGQWYIHSIFHFLKFYFTGIRDRKFHIFKTKNGNFFVEMKILTTITHKYCFKCVAYRNNIILTYDHVTYRVLWDKIHLYSIHITIREWKVKKQKVFLIMHPNGMKTKQITFYSLCNSNKNKKKYICEKGWLFF